MTALPERMTNPTTPSSDVAITPTAAVRYVCSYRAAQPHAPHIEGYGKPKRKYCECGASTWTVLTGWWGVFVHSSFPDAGPSGDRYRKEDAISLHTREVQANLRVGDADPTGRLVVRWVNA